MLPISYSGYRFPPDIIQRAIWMYLRFTLSFRDVEELVAERGIVVTYESIRRLCSAGHGQALLGCPTPRFDCPAGSRFSPESAQMALPRWGQKNEVEQSGPRPLAAMRRQGQAPDTDSLHPSSREGQVSALARIRLCSSP